MEKQLKELDIQYENFQNQIKVFYEELGCTPEEAIAFLNDKSNFTEQEWKKIQSQREKLHADLFASTEKSRIKLSPANETESRYEQMLGMMKRF